MSVYLTNVERLALGCDSVVPVAVAKTKAQAYSTATGQSIYIDGIGVTKPAAPPTRGPAKGGAGTRR